MKSGFHRGISLPGGDGKSRNHPVSLRVIRGEFALERHFPAPCRRHPCSSFSPSPLDGGGGGGGGAPPPGGEGVCQAERLKLGQGAGLVVRRLAKAVWSIHHWPQPPLPPPSTPSPPTALIELRIPPSLNRSRVGKSCNFLTN